MNIVKAFKIDNVKVTDWMFNDTSSTRYYTDIHKEGIETTFKLENNNIQKDDWLVQWSNGFITAVQKDTFEKFYKQEKMSFIKQPFYLCFMDTKLVEVEYSCKTLLGLK